MPQHYGAQLTCIDKVRLTAVPVSQLYHPRSTQQAANSPLQKNKSKKRPHGLPTGAFYLAITQSQSLLRMYGVHEPRCVFTKFHPTTSTAPFPNQCPSDACCLPYGPKSIPSRPTAGPEKPVVQFDLRGKGGDKGKGIGGVDPFPYPYFFPSCGAEVSPLCRPLGGERSSTLYL